MLPNRFNKMAVEEQLRFIQDKADVLLELAKYNLKLYLYTCGNFYIEVFRINDTGEVINIYAFEDLINLEPYLEQIDISEVYAAI